MRIVFNSNSIYLVVRSAMRLEVDGRRPRGRLMKIWSKVVSGRRHEEVLNIMEDMA